MHRGFNLNLNLSEKFIEEWSKKAEALYQKEKSVIRAKLMSFCLPEGALDASKMQSNWFPEIDAQVFISHAHKDERMALALAAWLNDKFKIKSFVDSCVWGNSTDLLKEIDEKYCKDPGDSTYIYSKRNRSTSHVHMMLSTALMKMIDKCECLFFLNTPASMTPKGLVNDSGTTGSPWIYSEVVISQLIQSRTKDEHRGLVKKALKKSLVEADLAVQYALDLKHLALLDEKALSLWQNECQGRLSTCPEQTLDVLYEQHPARSRII